MTERKLSQAPGTVETTDPIKVAVIDITKHRRNVARDAADARLNDETAANYSSRWEAVKDVRGTLRRIWKGNIFREYYQQKYLREEESRLIDSGNLYLHDAADDTEARLAVVDRFTSEYDEVIHTDAGERRDVHGEGDTTVAGFRTGVKDLIRDYVSGTLDDVTFEDEKNRLIGTRLPLDEDMERPGVYADNLLKIAQHVRAAMDHGRSLDEMLDGMQLVTGEASMGARTEARFNIVDKVINKLSKTKVGSLVPEATLASAVAIATGFVKWGSQKTLAMATAVTGALGLSTGIIGGLKESKRIKEDRALHMRERAIGKVFEDRAKRRGELEGTRYETIGANNLVTQIEQLYDDEGNLTALDGDGYARAMALIGSVTSRIKLSDSKKIDLIHFSSIEAVEEERMALDIALARAKVNLRSFLESQADDFLPVDIRGNDFNWLLQSNMTAASGEIHQENDAKDRVFGQLKRKEVFKAARRAFGWGMLFGVAAQETLSHIPGNNSYAGLGQNSESAERTTLLRSIFGGNKSSELIPDPSGGGNLIPQQLGDRSTLNLPEGYTVSQNPGGSYDVLSPSGDRLTTLSQGPDGKFAEAALDGAPRGTLGFEDALDGRGVGLSGEVTRVPIWSDNKLMIPKEYSVRDLADRQGGFELLDQNGDVITALAVNKDGTLTDAARTALSEAGLGTIDDSETIITSIELKNASAAEALWANIDQAEKIRREAWMGNNTPGVYDLNELRAHAGGVNGTWHDANGNVIIDVSRMRPDWSYQGSRSVNPFESVENGTLKASISMSRDTQDFVFAYDFQTTPDGRTIAVIPPDSPVYSLFPQGKATPQGHGGFNGGLIEITHFTGTESDRGSDSWILATYPGKNNAEFTQVIEVPKDIQSTIITAPVHETQTITFTPLVESGPEQLVTPVVPIPIYARRGLERMRNRVRYGYDYGNYYSSPDRIRELRKDISPRLLRDPDAILNPAEELRWYRKQLRKRRGPAYINRIDDAIRAGDMVRNITASTKAIVAIPVGAVSEADNIYKTLAIYAKQGSTALSQTTFLLHVNWIDDAMGDPEKKAKIEKTKQEIDRAKADFPMLRICSFETEWSREEVQKNGAIIGEVARRLYDTSMMLADSAIEQGAIPPDRDILVIRNDADAHGLSANYLGNMIKSSDEKPEKDAFVGNLRWQTSRHEEFPGFGIVTNLTSLLAALSGRKSSKDRVPTSGANTAIRSSTFAAISGVGFGTNLAAGSDDVELGSRLYAVRSGSVSKKRLKNKYSRLRRSKDHKSGYATPGSPEGTARPIEYVRGAHIDTDADRALIKYRTKGKTILETWDDFDEGGYAERDSGKDNADLAEPENIDIDSNIDEIADRISTNIEVIARHYTRDRSAVSMGLAIQFPKVIPRGLNKGKPVYVSKWTGGKFHFQFTAEGKVWLKNAITRDVKGRYDPFGTRVRRGQYQEVKPGAAKSPVTDKPKMVTA